MWSRKIMKCKLFFIRIIFFFLRVNQDTAVLAKFPATHPKDCIRGPRLQL